MELNLALDSFQVRNKREKKNNSKIEETKRLEGKQLLKKKPFHFPPKQKQWTIEPLRLFARWNLFFRLSSPRQVDLIDFFFSK